MGAKKLLIKFVLDSLIVILWFSKVYNLFISSQAFLSYEKVYALK